MSALAFFADRSQVYMRDGPWAARLDQAQTDSLLDIFDAADAVSSFNALYEACQAAGYIEHPVSRKVLRLVSSRDHAPNTCVASADAPRGRTNDGVSR